MLLRAWKLRTPSHTSPFLPRDLSISQEKTSGSDFISQ
jgi:hypothetical protein